MTHGTATSLGRLSVIVSLLSLASCATGSGTRGIDYAAMQNRILIGTATTLRSFNGTGRNTHDRYYASMVKRIKKGRPDYVPLMTQENFRQRIGGWTDLKTATIPLVMSLYYPALVPVELKDEIKFPTTMAAVATSATGDLLAARTNSDGQFVIDTILCRQESVTYYSCVDSYQAGIYDATSGNELNFSMEPKPSGKSIDVISYRVIGGN